MSYRQLRRAKNRWTTTALQLSASSGHSGLSVDTKGLESMTPEERYLFDLQGYLVLRGALDDATLCRLNQTVDELESKSDQEVAFMGVERRYRRLDNLYAQVRPAPEGRLQDYDCAILCNGGPFEELIDWPVTLPLVQEMIGEPMKLDAASFMSRNPGGAFRFHHGYAELLPYSEYRYSEGRFECVSLKIGYALTDVDVADGAFAVIPSSHKSNFTNPLVAQVPDPNHPLVQALPCRAGDAIIFSEDLSHGAVENNGTRTRRTLFYSYAPAYQCHWPSLGEPADGFEQRAPPRRLELVRRQSSIGA